jgi:acyl carrier protein
MAPDYENGEAGMAEQATTLDESLRAEIKDLICEILKADPSTVTLTSRFVEDHGADSLQYMDVLASIERLCGVLIAPEEMGKMTTLAGIYTVIEQAR